MDFHVFVGGPYWGVKSDRIANVELKRIGSGLVVQRFSFGWIVCFSALYHLGMVPGSLDLKGFGKVRMFMIFYGGVPKSKKHENAE